MNTKSKSAAKSVAKTAAKPANAAKPDSLVAQLNTGTPAPVAAIGANTHRAIIGAKKHIRELLSRDGVSMSLDELCKASGKSEVNVRTMLSDLRSPKYAGKDGVFLTISTRGADGVTRYSKAPAVVAPQPSNAQ